MVDRSIQTVSVVLATYNGEKFLRLQLESIADQTFQPYELVISDDNSSDATREIIADFAKRAPFPVKVMHNVPGLGFRDNFLSACKFATGQWIAFCDQDDVWRKDKLAKCHAMTGDPRITVIVHQATLIDADGNERGRFDQGITKNSVRGTLTYDLWGTFWGFSMLVRRSVIEVVPAEERFIDYIDPRHLIAHDRWAFFLGQTLGYVAEIAEPLASYRQHGANIYGASKRTGRPSNRDDTLTAQTPYLDSTRDMQRIVMALPVTTVTTFPAFDRHRAISVLAKAVIQQEHRKKIYASTRLEALTTMVTMMVKGSYRSATDNRIRWRSILRDFNIDAATRHKDEATSCGTSTGCLG